MTGRTHDLAAFTALTATIAFLPLEKMTIATAVVAFGANMLGGLAPDIDQSTSGIWKEIRFGKFFGKLISPLFGKHRFISHSIIGVILFGVLTSVFLGIIRNILIVDMNIIWFSFMIGFLSHLVADMLTHDGIPLLFPIPIRFGFPPFSFLRMKTGGIIEKGFVFPGLVLLNMYLFYANSDKFVTFFKEFIIR